MKEKTNSDKIFEIYKKEEEKIKELRDKANPFQNAYKFKEFKDVTIRCENAEINYIRYCIKNNIQYDNQDVLPIYEAYHVYVYKMFEKAFYELSRYLEERNMIFLGKQLTIKEKIKSMLSIDNTRKLYLPIQNHVTNYEKISDDITNIDVKRDIKDIMITYIDFLYDSLKNFCDDTNKTNNMFQSMMTQMRPYFINALKKLELYEGILVIDEEVVKLTSQKEEKAHSRNKIINFPR